VQTVEFNLFLWIRQGVKQSVLLGVSDAIEAIGTPDNSEDISPRLLQFMREGADDNAASRVSGETRRKRLGKSLKDLETPT
jgi:hypothetical protein